MNPPLPREFAQKYNQIWCLVNSQLFIIFFRAQLCHISMYFEDVAINFGWYITVSCKTTSLMWSLPSICGSFSHSPWLFHLFSPRLRPRLRLRRSRLPPRRRAGARRVPVPWRSEGTPRRGRRVRRRDRRRPRKQGETGWNHSLLGFDQLHKLINHALFWCFFFFSFLFFFCGLIKKLII